jgi:hypothetical protein
LLSKVLTYIPVWSYCNKLFTPPPVSCFHITVRLIFSNYKSNHVISRYNNCILQEAQINRKMQLSIFQKPSSNIVSRDVESYLIHSTSY